MNGQARYFHADDILTNDITSSFANAIGFVMEARHGSPTNVPSALYEFGSLSRRNWAQGQ